MPETEQNSVYYLQFVRQTGNAANCLILPKTPINTPKKSLINWNEYQAEPAKLRETKPNGSSLNVAAHRDALGQATQSTVDDIQKRLLRNTAPRPPPLFRKRWGGFARAGSGSPER
jgi:hypothetical protein